jgi:hypothetical protein
LSFLLLRGLKEDATHVASAIEKADDAGFMHGNTKIDAIVAENMQSKARTDPFPRDATVTEFGESYQFVVNALEETLGDLCSRPFGQMLDGASDVGTSRIRNVQLFGGKRRRGRHAELYADSRGLARFRV